MHSLDAIFSPQSIAVVGASSSPGKVGHDIFCNILQGGLHGGALSRKSQYEAVSGVRAYSSMLEIPDEVDLAIIILPPKLATRAVTEAVDKGAKGIVIVSAGFKEVGKEGLEIENNIVSICRKSGVRLVGAQLPRRDQSHARDQAEREFFRSHARAREDLVHIPERCPLHIRSRFRRRQGLRVLEIHQYRQQGGRG